IVITGGEPLHHDLAPLASELRSATSLPIHLETSGVDPLSGSPDWITLSPKRHAPPRQELLNKCHELKVIVHEPADLEFALLMAESTLQSKCNGDAKLFLQPGWECSEGLRLSIDFVKRHPSW
ncbi:MAG: 7-carboxy-7-deazaguanine synthase QueE, partial [bacterium]